MADESRGPLEGCIQPLQATVSDGEEPSVAGDGGRLTATLIAKKLRDSGVGCEIVHPIATDAAVCRRDRAVIVLAVALLTAFVWSYLFGSPRIWKWTAWP